VIAHVSLPADDCRRVAEVLAAMTDGDALRFPPGGPDAWNVWPRDGSYQLVVTPRGHYLVAGPDGQAWEARAVAPGRASETHVALAVERPAADVVALAREAGWAARVCDRGGLFGVVEVWVENAYLVEVLDPTQMADYRRTMTVDAWKRAFGPAA
jgi:hypothetical protein